MKTDKRKEETCEEQLRSMCKSIAMDITNGKEDASKWMEDVYNIRYLVDREKRTETASDWMEGVYDIRYLVDREKKYLGCELMVAGGGPTIWVNTWTNEVEGSWWGDKCTHHFQDNIGLDQYNEEMYNCS